jgi:transposase, IS6 family
VLQKVLNSGLINFPLGFVSFSTARRTIRGYESMNMIRKGQVEGIEKGNVIRQISFIHEILSVVASVAILYKGFL